MQQSMWITILAMDMSTFRRHRQRRRPWKEKLLLKGIARYSVSQSNITMQTMAYARPKHGRIHVMSQGKASHALVSMHTFNLEWLRDAFGTCKRLLAPAFFTSNIDGKKLSIPTFGLMQSEGHALFTTKHRPSE
jgi:hypothetical protein